MNSNSLCVLAMNVQRSLDTLDPFKFELITRRNGHDAVLKSLDVALASRLQSIKVNVVMMKDLNESEVLDFVKMTKEQPISVRFIEFMPFTGLYPRCPSSRRCLMVISRKQMGQAQNGPLC